MQHASFADSGTACGTRDRGHLFTGEISPLHLQKVHQSPATSLSHIAHPRIPQAPYASLTFLEAISVFVGKRMTRTSFIVRADSSCNFPMAFMTGYCRLPDGSSVRQDLERSYSRSMQLLGGWAKQTATVADFGMSNTRHRRLPLCVIGSMIATHQPSSVSKWSRRNQ
jgi:hypothetical protein